MKIKVCGMKYPENIEAIQLAKPDFLGFIFYEKSPRFVNKEILASIKKLDQNIQTIGVFVNSPIDKVTQIVNQYDFDFVQLHGDESVEYTKALSSQNIKVIKAFQIKENFNWEKVCQYTPYVAYNLFDTATSNYGGSGLKFDWQQLTTYKGETPFFLSGGITINDVSELINLDIPKLQAIDINSKFEEKPGFKNVEQTTKMINEIRNERHVSRK